MIFGYMLDNKINESTDIESIQEGIFFNNPDKLLQKLERVLNSYEKYELTFFSPDHYFRKLDKLKDKGKLNEKQLTKLNELHKKYAEIDASRFRKRLEGKVKEYKKHWDTGSNEKCTWEGDFINFCATTLCYTEEQVVKHFTKIQSKIQNILKDVIDEMYGRDSDPDEYEYILKTGLTLEDKVVSFYSNDDVEVIYCFRTKKFYEIFFSDDKINIISSCFKTIFDDWDWDEVYKDIIPYKDSDLYQQTGISFDI